jgi:hypothetical protein
MIAWSVENNGTVDVERIGRGYIGQETDVRIANEMKTKNESGIA